MARKSRKGMTAAVSAPESTVYEAAGYIRLSADDTRKCGDSIESQRRIILNYIESTSGIRLHDLYIDNKITGTHFDRPEFQRMLSDMEAGIINCIIVKDLSRFGRNAIDTGYYIERLLPSKGVRFIAVNDDFDTDNAGHGGIILPLKNMMNEAYALDIGKKVKAVHRQHMKSGLFAGSHAPYGYLKAPDNCHKLVIDPATSPVVRQIFEWAHSGANLSEITRRLNDSGITTPSRYKQACGEYTNPNLIGREHWQRITVKGILSDRVYVGDLIQGKTKKVNNRQIDRAPEDWIEVKNTHEPIIGREMFDEVQQILAKAAQAEISKRAPTIPYTEHVFAGKIICAHCGYVMHRHRTKNVQYNYWFNCQTQVKISKHACVQVSVKEEVLKSSVLALLQRYAEILTGKYISLREPKETTDIEAELRTIRAGQDENERFLKGLYESLVSELITAEEHRKMKVDYETKMADLLRRAEELRERKRTLEAQAIMYRDLSEAVSGIQSNDDLTAALMELLVDKILVSRDKSFEIHFRFTDEIHHVGGLALCANM